MLRRYVVADSGCWEWTGAKNLQGYGAIGLYLGGRAVVVPTHRLQWMHTQGEIPTGMVIMHTCDNPCCINPDHLRLGSYGDNIKDCVTKGRHDSQGARPFWERYRRNEVPYMGLYRSERHPGWIAPEGTSPPPPSEGE